MHAKPMMNRCTTCGQEWWDAHVCPKQVLKDGRTMQEWVTATKIAAPSLLADDGWPKLTTPARVGNGTFGVGVSARLVVEAAQRQHQYRQSKTPAAEREHAEALACAMEFVRERQAKTQALIAAGKCHDCEGVGVWGGQFTGGWHPCETCGGTGKA